MRIGGVWVRDLRRDMRATASQAGSVKEYGARRAEEIERIVIHHTAGAHEDHTASSIALYHVKHLGWPGIGYHFVVHWDGRVEYVGDLLTVRYHCGLLNRGSVGVCLTGCFVAGRMPTQRQLMRARMIVDGLRLEMGRQLPAVGHRDISDLTGYGYTACPGDWWRKGALG